MVNSDVFCPRFRMENNDPIMRPEAQPVSMDVYYSARWAQRWIQDMKSWKHTFLQHSSTIMRKYFGKLSNKPCQSNTDRPALFVSGCWSLILFFLNFIIRMVLSCELSCVRASAEDIRNACLTDCSPHKEPPQCHMSTADLCWLCVGGLASSMSCFVCCLKLATNVI